MKHGVVFPQTEFGNDIHAIKDCAQTAEGLGSNLAEAGRDRAQFGIDPWISIAGLEQGEWRRRVEAWRRLGATHLAVDTMRAGFATPKAHIDAIRSFREVC